MALAVTFLGACRRAVPPRIPRAQRGTGPQARTFPDVPLPADFKRQWQIPDYENELDIQFRIRHW